VRRGGCTLDVVIGRTCSLFLELCCNEVIKIMSSKGQIDLKSFFASFLSSNTPDCEILPSSKTPDSETWRGGCTLDVVIGRTSSFILELRCSEVIKIMSCKGQIDLKASLQVSYLAILPTMKFSHLAKTPDSETLLNLTRPGSRRVSRLAKTPDNETLFDLTRPRSRKVSHLGKASDYEKPP